MASTNKRGVSNTCDFWNPSSNIGDSNCTNGNPNCFLIFDRSGGNCDVVCIVTNSSVVCIFSCSIYT